MSQDLAVVEFSESLTPEEVKERTNETLDALLSGYNAVRAGYPFTSYLSDLISYYSSSSERKKFLISHPQLRKALNFSPLTAEQDKTAGEIFGRYSNALSDISFSIDTYLEGGDLDRETLLIMARINQEAALCLYDGLIDRQQRESEWDLNFVDVLEVLAGSHVRGSHFIAEILSGARAQAGLMHLLWKNGYLVLPLDLSVQSDEVETLDVDSGIDFLAIAPKTGMVYALDAKARKMVGEGELVQQRATVGRFYVNLSKEELKKRAERVRTKIQAAYEDQDTPPESQRLLRLVLNRETLLWRLKKIVLPSSEFFLDRRGKITDERIQKEAIMAVERD